MINYSFLALLVVVVFVLSLLVRTTTGQFITDDPKDSLPFGVVIKNEYPAVDNPELWTPFLTPSPIFTDPPSPCPTPVTPAPTIARFTLLERITTIVVFLILKISVNSLFAYVSIIPASPPVVIIVASTSTASPVVVILAVSAVSWWRLWRIFA